MKELNKILYDILLKLDLQKDDEQKFKINLDLIKNYFKIFDDEGNEKLSEFSDYFTSFYDFCFELSLNNMIEKAIKFKK